MVALGLKPAYATMIIPSVWFTGGKGLDDFREYMLDNKGLKLITNFITSQDVFPHVNLRGCSTNPVGDFSPTGFVE